MRLFVGLVWFLLILCTLPVEQTRRIVYLICEIIKGLKEVQDG